MAQMATIPVFACRRCGQPVVVTYLSSIGDDPNSERLLELMRGLENIALCKECLKAYNWFANQNRAEEFLLNPHIVIYNVHDLSGLDYYGRKS